MRLPPLDASSAFQCVFCLQMRLPLRDLSYASRPDSCTRLPRHILSPAVQLVSRFGSSPLLTSRDIPRHHATYCDVPRYLAPPASLPLPTQLSRDIPRHPAAPASVAHVPSLGYPTTSRDPVASSAAPCDPQHHYVFRSVALSSDQPSVRSNESRNASCTTARIPHSAPDLHPLPPRSCLSPAVALLRFALCSLPPFGFLLIPFYVLYLIRVTLYIRPRLQVDPYPFLFGSPARYALLFSLSLYNKLNPSDPLLVPRSAPRLARPQ